MVLSKSPPPLASPLIAALLAVTSPALADDPAPPIEDTGASSRAPGDAAPARIDVRVEGDRAEAPRASRDPDVASYVARGEALRRPGATSVDVIAASPGVQVARSGAGSDLATASIRGAASASLPVYLAGVRLNDDVTGGADLSTVPLFALDRVEIYRGNAPADADRLGIGGAIFFEPKLPRAARIGGSFGAGSFGELSFGASAATGSDRAGALFSIVRQSADNDFTYTDDRGTPTPADDRRVTRANADATTHDAWALGRVDLGGGGRLVMLANVFAREQGVTGAAITPARSARSAVAREIAAVSARLPCAGVTGSPQGTAIAPDAAAERCSIEIGAGAIASRRAISDPDRELGFLATRVLVSGERWQESLRVRARVGERWRVGGAVFTGVDRLGLDLSNGARTRSARLGVTGSLNTAWQVTDRVELFGLAGGECHTSLETEGASACALGGPAGRVGLRILAPLGIDVIASGGSYLRVPTLGELHGLSATVLGNPDLVPERGFTGEVGVRWGGAALSGEVKWFADVTAFARQAEDLIAYRRTSKDTIAPFNVANARTLGLELLAGAQVTSHVRAEQALTLLDPRDVTPGRTETNDLLPYQAAVTSISSLELSADTASWARVMDRVALTASLRYRSARYADAAGTYVLAEQRDLGLDASAFFFGRRLALRGGVTNMLDAINQDLLGFPLPARAFHGAVEGSW